MNFPLLTIVILTVFYSFTSLNMKNSKIRPLERLIALITLFLVAIFTIFPFSTAQPLADIFRIKRGVDFIIYSYIFCSIILFNMIYRRLIIIETRQNKIMQNLIVNNSSIKKDNG